MGKSSRCAYCWRPFNEWDKWTTMLVVDKEVRIHLDECLRRVRENKLAALGLRIGSTEEEPNG